LISTVPKVFIIGGRIASRKLEYNLVDHCNLACDECSHFSPHLRRHALPLETFVRDLDRLAGVYHAGRFRFVGGEPLLNPTLLDYVAAVRRSGICDEVEVVSNGVLLERMKDEFFKEIDSLKISQYPDSRCDDRLVRYAKERCRAHGTKFSCEKITVFRRMQVSRPISDDSLVSSIFDTCMIAHTWACHTFYDGRFYLCSRPIYTGQFLESLGRTAPGFRALDGEPLHQGRLLERLIGLLERAEPLAA
jgi:cyclic pyranopterin phosphate synthase